MSRRQRLEEAARSLEPMRQGSLDGLCGLYAVINAVRLVLYPDRRLTQREMAALFAAGLETIRKAQTIRSVLVNGMHRPVWDKLSSATVARAAAITGERLELVRVPLPVGTDAFVMIRLLRRNVSAGRPVLLNVEGKFNHWTVVSRFSRTRLTLFDSSGHCWFLVRCVGLAGDTDERHYRVPSRGLIALCRQTE